MLSSSEDGPGDKNRFSILRRSSVYLKAIVTNKDAQERAEDGEGRKNKREYGQWRYRFSQFFYISGPLSFLLETN